MRDRREDERGMLLVSAKRSSLAEKSVMEYQGEGFVVEARYRRSPPARKVLSHLDIHLHQQFGEDKIIQILETTRTKKCLTISNTSMRLFDLGLGVVGGCTSERELERK